MTGCCQVTTTLPDRPTAERLAAQLVAERLAACAQVQGPIESIFRWQDGLQRATEWCCHLKTTAARFPALRARIREVHPYEVPEIIALPLADGDPVYLRWIEDSVSSDPTPR